MISLENLQRTVKVKLITSLVVIIIVYSIFNAVYNSSRQKSSAVNHVNTHVESLIDMLSFSIGAGLADSNFELVQSTFDWAKKDKAVMYIAIYDEDNELTVDVKIEEREYNPAKYLSESGLIFEKDVLTAVSLIDYKNENYGKVILFYSLKNSNDEISSARTSSIVISLLFLVISTGILLYFARIITGAIKEMMNTINNLARQVSSGSNQVSSTGQALAEGTTEQAGSIEEITSSMNEIADQTKKNSISATNANDLAAQSRKNAESGNEQMKKMLKAMSDVSDSSNEISKIIKVIDEIAFQTNLLALNAAVEAARAGDAGKGFAVVAEEVRNLAGRSAQAAKETTTLIEESIGRVKIGYELSNETAEALEEIGKGISKVTHLVGNIAEDSKDQADKIESITEGLIQVEQVTQANSANAEESAAASQELSSQAEQLKRVVGDMSNVEDEIEKVSGKRQSKNVSQKINGLSIKKHGSGISLDENYSDF